jgi:hypothetical protein
MIKSIDFQRLFSDACLLKQTGKPRNGIGRHYAICQDEGCIENVADSIDSEDRDIVALQEATNHEGIKAVSKQLKSMNHVSGVAGKEE